MSKQFSLYCLYTADDTEVLTEFQFAALGVTFEELASVCVGDLRKEEITLQPNLDFDRETRVRQACMTLAPSGFYVSDETKRPAASVEEYVRSWSFVKRDEQNKAVLGQDGVEMPLFVSAQNFGTFAPNLADALDLEVATRVRPGFTGGTQGLREKIAALVSSKTQPNKPV